MGLESINEKLLARSAGWEAMKRARQYLASGAVLEATWRDSKALGKIQAGGQVFQAGLHFEIPDAGVAMLPPLWSGRRLAARQQLELH